jgi:hypothetical protein
VGLIAAAVHAGILLFIQWITLSLANPIAFLATSFTGYAGHALVTKVPRGDRWQTLCKPLASAPIRSESELLRPAALILGPWGHPILYSVVLITPKILNALIWSRAAQFSAQQRNQLSSPPLRHADDLGLGSGIDQAIFDLVKSSRLYEASLLVYQEITVCSLKQAATAQRAFLAIRRLRFGMNCKETPLSHRLQKLKPDHP